MPARRRRRTVRRRRTTTAPRRRRRRNAGYRSKASYTHRRRTKRRNPGYSTRRRRYTRRRVARRNPSNILSGTLRNTFGVLGGAAIVKLAVDRLPYGLNQGHVGYLSTAIASAVAGFAVAKFGRSKVLGEMVALGGFAYLVLRLLEDFIPSLAAISPFGLRGMGVIGPSSFYQPQVPRPGSMHSFQTPAATMAAIPQATSLQGMGMNRRFARVR